MTSETSSANHRASTGSPPSRLIISSRLCQCIILASEGRQGITLYLDCLQSAEPVDLVIVDLTIPDGLGEKGTMVELQKIDPNVRAIVSSGYPTDPVFASFKEHGFCAAVTKPYTLKKLADGIEVTCR